MAGHTYDSLKEDLQDWTEDSSDEFVNNIDMIMELGQTRLQRDLDLDIFVDTSEAVLSQGSYAIQRPTGMLEPISLYRVASGQRVPLLKRTYEYVQDYSPNPSSQGTPLYYAEDNTEQIIVSPTPSTDMSYLLRFWTRIALLSASNQTNWLSINMGDLLLFACLEESEAFIMEDDDGGTRRWDGKYERGLPSARDEVARLSRKGTQRFKVQSKGSVPPEVADGN